MLALESISSANAIGTPLFAKNVRCCGTPFSMHHEVAAIEIDHILSAWIGHRHAERHEIDADAKRLRAAVRVDDGSRRRQRSDDDRDPLLAR